MRNSRFPSDPRRHTRRSRPPPRGQQGPEPALTRLLWPQQNCGARVLIVATAAVIFDFFGTLSPSTPTSVWDDHAARSAAPLGIPVPAWRAVLDASFPERATGSLGDLTATFRTLARRAGADPGDQALAAACAARAATQRELFELRADAVSTLAELRARGLRLGVLSDCTTELAETWTQLPLAGLVDARVLSCEEGRRKPDPELFRLIAGRLGVAPRDCLYVGDGGGGELTGASRCGMRAFMLRGADWADNDAHAREDNWAGPVLLSLTDVLTVIPASPTVSDPA
jgi:putative hydrolase of the HAD superfamily